MISLDDAGKWYETTRAHMLALRNLAASTGMPCHGKVS